ncbi:DUF1643 domain-containing protein [Polaromonas naphthalenivorans]|uniref:Uncharacterized protein n=1 Tax=Polaromonas naphthalenivorans (strain CJ2) TaxID=365044 RepID=A1VWF5_POLNA|nr:hypothetical protein Pnap_4919 [Polaromonas naphthalenivorans CJ2]
MTNLFAFRAPQPSDMVATADPTGPENDQTLLRIAQGLASSWQPGVLVVHTKAGVMSYRHAAKPAFFEAHPSGPPVPSALPAEDFDAAASTHGCCPSLAERT